MTNKITLVTGGSRGLGSNTVLHLAEKGVGVVLTFLGHSDEASAVVAKIEYLGGRAAAFQLNRGDTAQFMSFAEHLANTFDRVWGRHSFDSLVNNAGININSSFAETTEDEFDTVMNIHLKGVFFLTQRLLPSIENGGRVVNLSSGLARFSLPGYATAMGRAGLPDDIGGAIPSLLVGDNQ